MFRSSARLDHAYLAVFALLSLALAPVAANAGEMSSEAQQDLSRASSACQATTPVPPDTNAAQPATEQSTDDDFFSWIKKMVAPTATEDGQQPYSTPARPPNFNKGGNDNGHDGHGNGSHGNGSHGH
jgi:hypothetical protein